ncbi:MAG: hypothetical protein DCC55_36260 [Chloroflexi bacterium]|nr:MAG: hypothetical protein DCC55_36260 [Chloroflexota bacterium]
MNMVIREYLSMLKESGELDALVPDLLLAMGIEPLSKPQVGVRQFGVDVAAVGPDPEDNDQVKLFLITIKQGDLDRNSWDNDTPQAVRPSLNEIQDVYIPGHVLPEHVTLPKKIIVCCNGDKKPNVHENWKGLIERYFLDEYLFPEDTRKLLRKTIALADQNEDEPRYFYELVETILFKSDLPIESIAPAKRARRRALGLLNLSLNIVFHWCQEAENLRPALLCAEHTVLVTWDWARQSNLFDCESTMEGLEGLYRTYLKISATLVQKLLSICFVRDGFFIQAQHDLHYPLLTFEVIGILATCSLANHLIAATISSDSGKEQFMKRAAVTAQALAELLKNNPAAHTPLYDSHAVDIALGLLTLYCMRVHQTAREWVEQLAHRIHFAYQLGRMYPIASDSFEDLVAIKYEKDIPKEKLMDLSTLLPMLAHWFAILGMNEPYQQFQKNVTTTFAKTNLQLWYPDASTDQVLYRTNAGRESGMTLASIELPKDIEELRTEILRLNKLQEEVISNLSCMNQGVLILPLLASRHFRTPVIPWFWQSLISEEISEATQ